MKVVLASAPTLLELERFAREWEAEFRRVPLGVLALAAALERHGDSPEVVNLDTAFAEWMEAGGERTAFPDHAADELARREADLYGLGTICSSYPATLRIATALKRRRPSCRIVLGGPQATATDLATLAAFPAVDLVLRGESDRSLPELVASLAAGGDGSSVRGLTLRAGGVPVRTPDAAPLDDLDALPLPAYHLCQGITPAQSMPVEAGRGCPFACAFCSTSRHFGRRFRMRSPERIVGDMLLLRGRYGVRRFELVHDNFTVDRERVLAFCRALSASGARVAWTCSSRCDAVDEELLAQMWRAGCRGLFFGVESGSARVQQAIGKSLDLDLARRRLGAVGRRRIPSTVAFMTGFPQETVEDLRATVDGFVDALRRDCLEPQLSLLAPLPGTPILEQHRRSLFLDEIVSDMSFQGEAQDGADQVLVARHPELFSSFYAVPSPGLERRELQELRCFLHAARSDLRWLLVAAARLCGGGLEAFRAFRAWRRVGPGAESISDMQAYYRDDAFPRDLVRFAREVLPGRAAGTRAAVTALATLCSVLARRARGRGPGRGRARPRGPALAPGLRVAQLGCDGAALLRCVKRGGDLSRVPRGQSGILARRRDRRLRVWHLSGPAALLLALCDGTRSERSIARAFAARYPTAGGVAGARACAFGLAALARRGFLVPPPTG